MFKKIIITKTFIINLSNTRSVPCMGLVFGFQKKSHNHDYPTKFWT